MAEELTPEHAVKHYTQLMRRVRIGAYDEREPDGSYGADGIEESIDNLTTWAAKQGLAFHMSDAYVLEPMTAKEKVAYELAQEMTEAEAVAATQAAHDFPYAIPGETFLYQYHPESARFYVEVFIEHHDPEQGKATVLYRVWRNDTGQLSATKVDIQEVE